MKCVRRIVGVTWRLLVPADEAVMLRHVASGRVLTDGSEGILFPSAGAASRFRSRYLDEADGWEAIPLEQLVSAA